MANVLGQGTNLGALSTPGDVLGAGEQFILNIAKYSVINVIGIIVLVGGIYLLFKPEIDSNIVEPVKAQAREAARTAAATAAE